MTEQRKNGSIVMRDTLRFSLRHPEDESERAEAMRAYIERHAGEAGVIFCSTSYGAASLYRQLLRYGTGCVCETSGEAGTEEEEAFLSGESSLLVTVSGMERKNEEDFLKKPGREDIRYTIHDSLPLDPETYLREACLAGQDGKPAESVLFYLPGDRRAAERLLWQSAYSQRNRSLFGRGAEGEDMETILQRSEERLEEMIRYCELPEETGSAALRKELQKMTGAVTEKKTAAGKSSGKKTGKKPAEEKKAEAPKKTAPKKPDDKKQTAVKKTAPKKSDDKKQAAVKKTAPKQKAAVRRTAEKEDRPLDVYYAVRKDTLKDAAGPLTYFDRMAADAVLTLIRSGQKKIFTKHVMEVLSGNSNLTLRPEKKQEVEESLGRLPGQVFEKEKKALFSIPPETLHVPGLPTSKENLAVTHYLYCRIRDGKKEIPCADIWKDLQISFPSGIYYIRRKEDTLRDKIRTVMEHFRAGKIIRGYTVEEDTVRWT